MKRSVETSSKTQLKQDNYSQSQQTVKSFGTRYEDPFKLVEIMSYNFRFCQDSITKQTLGDIMRHLLTIETF